MLKNIGWLGYNDTKLSKMAGSTTEFPFNENLDATLSLIESVSFDKLPESASIVTETSFEMQNEEPEAHLCTRCFKTFKTARGLQCYFSSKHNKKDLHKLLIMKLSHPNVN